MNYYPLRLQPIYKDRVWGSRRLETVLGRKDIPGDHIGESWDVTCREDAMSVVKNGLLQGKTLEALIDDDHAGFLGKNFRKGEPFPLLVKQLDCNEDLSIQVHPVDAVAQKLENYPFGKNEMWYVLQAPNEGSLIIGLKPGVTKKDYEAAEKEGNLSLLFGRLPVQVGDVVNIPAGLIHALTSGTIVTEVQQNSDITYRIYDYDRVGLDGKPRELHQKKALEAIDFSGKLPQKVEKGISYFQNGAEWTWYIANPYFVAYRLQTKETVTLQENGNHFTIYTCVNGAGEISGGGETVPLRYGESLFLPAGLEKHTVSGGMTLLGSFVSRNLWQDVCTPLQEAGILEGEIKRKLGI